MTELEIDKEDICAMKNWRRNVMDMNSNPIVNCKPNCKSIIYQRNGHLNPCVSL